MAVSGGKTPWIMLRDLAQEEQVLELYPKINDTVFDCTSTIDEALALQGRTQVAVGL